MFVTDLDLRAMPEPDLWCVDSPLIWDDPLYGQITVPNGAHTDLASVPFFLRGVLDVTGRSRRPGVLHDWVYRHPMNDDGGRFTRKDCDDLLRLALIVEGSWSVTALTYWLGVRIGGWAAWNRYRDV